MPFVTGQSWRVLKSWYTRRGPEQGFRGCFACGPNLSLISCVAQAPILILIYAGVYYLLLTTSGLVTALNKSWITCDLRREVFKRRPVCGAVNTL